MTEDVKELARDVGETVSEEADETEMVGRFDPHSRARQGETIEAVVDTCRRTSSTSRPGPGSIPTRGKESGMSRNSRTLLGLAAAFLLLLLAVACGGDDGDTGASGDTGAGATGEKVSETCR